MKLLKGSAENFGRIQLGKPREIQEIPTLSITTDPLMTKRIELETPVETDECARRLGRLK